MFSTSLARGSVRSVSLAVACLAGAVAALVWTYDEQPLAAAANSSRSDQDRDGLTDDQERLLRTDALRKDSDEDGFSDLEELARGSDARDSGSMPGESDYGLGSCASQENDFVSFLSAVYLKDNAEDDFDLRLGFVYRGYALTFMPGAMKYMRAYLHGAQDPDDRIAVVEVGVPLSILDRLTLRQPIPGGGQRISGLSLFTKVTRRDSSEDPLIALLPLFTVNGVAVTVEHRVARGTNGTGGGGATGVVYRPLQDESELVNSAWVPGQACFLSSSAVGMVGASVVHDIESAACEEMDASCNPNACTGSAGSTLELPDPGALLGG